MHKNRKILTFFVSALFIVLVFTVEINGRVLNNEKVSKMIQLGEKYCKTTDTTFNSDDNFFYYDNKYAVIIVGYYGNEQHYGWFTNDAQRQYNVLTNKYGFNDSNVYVLLTLKEKWVGSLKVDPSIIDYNATEKNITMIFNNLKEIVTANDLLYVLVINHGGDKNHISYRDTHIDFWQGILAHDTYFALEKSDKICINKSIFEYHQTFNFNKSAIDNRVYDHELYDYTKDINARRIIYVLQPCFSGGFINDLSGKNHVVITASREIQLANAAFIGYFYYGLNGSADDKNKDDRLSLGEIFEYTAERVYQWVDDNPDSNGGQKQHPLIDDNRDRIGNRYGSYLGYNPDKKYKDGYVASRIYNLSFEDANLVNFNYKNVKYYLYKIMVLFFNFFENNPNLFPILKILLQRLG